MNRTLKLSLLCVGIFTAGAVAGGFAVRQVPRPGFGQPGLDGFGPQQLKRMAEGLNLTHDQREAIRPILQKTGEDLRVMRKESIARATLAIEAMDKAVARLLTPTQRERLIVLRAEERERMRAITEERQRRMGEREGEQNRAGERRREGEKQRKPERPGDSMPPTDAHPPEARPGPAS